MIRNSEMRVLECFVDRDTASFTELCETANYPTDLGGYYIRRLLAGGYILKEDRGTYTITPLGKQAINLFWRKQTLAPRLAVALVCTYHGSCAILHRTVQPFLGRHEWPAGIVLRGETVQQAASRVALDRLHVATDFELTGFFRRIDTVQDKLFDDKLFAVFRHELATEPNWAHTGTTGEILRVATTDLSDLPNRAKSLLDIWAYAEQPSSPLIERTYGLSTDDLSAPD